MDWWVIVRETVYFMAVWLLSGYVYSRQGGPKRMREKLKDQEKLIEHLRERMNYYAAKERES